MLAKQQRFRGATRVRPSLSLSSTRSTRAVSVAPAPAPSLSFADRAPKSPSSSPSTRTKRAGRLLLWTAVVLVHLLCALFYSGCAFLYHRIQDTIVAVDMRAFGLSLAPEHFPVLVVLHTLGAVAHALLLLEMLCRSMVLRRPVFTHEGSLLRKQQLRRRPRSIRDLSLTASLKKLPRNAVKTWARWFGHVGVFGVEQSYFPSLFLVRELGEISLQSYQALKMSRLVPRAWLNQLYVALIVCGCWATPVLEHMVYRGGEHHVRHALRMCLMVDVVLDFVSIVGIPTLLSIPYLQGYDPKTQDFRDELWNSDVWYMNMVNEFQLLFVQSWADCASHCVFGMSLLLSLDDVKILASSDDSDAAAAARHRSTLSPTVVALGRPRPGLIVNPQARSGPRWSWPWPHSHIKLSSVAHVAMVLWGFVVAVLHLEAQRDGHEVVGCLVHVHPWWSPKTACSLLQIDCLDANTLLLSAITPRGGAAQEIESAWKAINNDMLDLLTIVNCPALQIPSGIQHFSHLMGLNILNSTVVQWGSEAALNNRHHRNMRHLALVSVNLSPATTLSSAVFPLGLMAIDFPPLLRDIFIYDCNLKHGLPPELPVNWPTFANMLLPANRITEFPEQLLHMTPIRISLESNAVTSVPIAVFEIDSLVALELTDNPIQELPELLLPASSFKLGASLSHVILKGTNVSELPQWMLDQKVLSRVTVRAGGSPLCLGLQAETGPKSADSELLTKYIDCSE